MERWWNASLLWIRVETVEWAMIEHNIKAGENTIYVGPSLGAYVGFYVLSEYFRGAVLMDCGQNVGPNASLKARVGIWGLKFASSMMSNHALVKAMVGVSRKSPADFKLIESIFVAGMFFDQGAAQCE